MTETSLWEIVAARADNPLVFALIIAAAVYLFVSKRLAEIKGTFAWVGALARWWTARQQRRVQADADLWRVTHKVERERENAELEQLRADVEWLRGELTDMRRREAARDGQARLHTAWDNEWAPRARDAGIAIPEPPPLYLDLAPLYIPERTTDAPDDRSP